MTKQSNGQLNFRESDLIQFCGSSEFFQHWSKRLVYTEGVRYMAEHGGAHWLIDAVASYQPDNRITSRPDLVDFQLWELAVAEDKTAALTIRPDSGQPAVITQEIPFTDFPLKQIKLYACNGTLMLPSEY